MKQFSLALNILLVLAVATLFYLHFSGNAKTPKAAGNSSLSKDSCAIGHLIGYVEMDSVYSTVSYIKQRQNELDADQEKIKTEYNNSLMGLESKKNEFIQKNKSITQEMADQFQQQLYGEQQQIENRRQTQAQAMAKKRNEVMDDIQKNLKSLINDINADKKYSYIFATSAGMDNILYKDSTHNITGEVIEGLNKIFGQRVKK